MQARITIVGMENFLNSQSKSITDDWDLLDEDSQAIPNFDKDALLSAIINKGGTFEPLYTDPDFFYDACSLFWDRWSYQFGRLFLAFNKEYNPIHNYDRQEEYSGTVNDSGTVNSADSRTSTNSETTDQETNTANSSTESTHNENDTTVDNNVSSFESVGYMPHDESVTEETLNGSNTKADTSIGSMNTKADSQNIDSGVSNTASESETVDSHTLHVQGNIGVMDTQTMLTKEARLRMMNLYTLMASRFLTELTIKVY